MSIKLTYFNARGVAELIRYIFAYAGQEFEDERIQRESWAERKPDAPLGSVPYVVLESGERYAQATSLARFFADKFDIRGKTAEEKLQSDMIVDLVRTDIIPLLVKIFFEKDNEKKAALKKEAQDKVNVWFEKVEALYMKGESSVLGESQYSVQRYQWFFKTISDHTIPGRRSNLDKS